jgi:phosphohistidine phosphatase
MRQLLLLRHAKSSWDNKAMPDEDRPLSPRGRRAAAAMRQAMRELGLAPDMVMLSPSRRTRETLEALEPWDDAPLIEPMEVLYLATVGQLLAVLRGVPETVRSVLLIGHNPGMHELAVRLVGARGTAARHGRGDLSGGDISSRESADRDGVDRAGVDRDGAGRAIEQLAAGYPTGALAEFGIARPWSQLDAGGGQMIRFLRPRDLSRDGAEVAAD